MSNYRHDDAMVTPNPNYRADLDIAIRSLEIETNLTKSTNWADLKAAVLDAARKHLQTLPKPLWRVTAYLPNSGTRAAPYETSSRKEALDFARSYLDGGMCHVNVYQVQS